MTPAVEAMLALRTASMRLGEILQVEGADCSMPIRPNRGLRDVELCAQKARNARSLLLEALTVDELAELDAALDVA